MICPPLCPSRLVQGWMERHRDPASFALHMVGIPPTILGVLMIPIYVLLVSGPLFLVALALFVGGYLIQFLGHALQGTDPGEIILLKRKLGRPYVDVAPARESRSGLV
ncbi:MAG TPA: Mpo1-like protein [Isosphaeraceae bacterium]|nr:Mpo1-like protein [Isosphaeraceae bacterium]